MIFLHILAYYWLFAAAISVYRNWVTGKLSTINRVLFAPLLIGFFATDVLLNWTAACLVFWGLPPQNCATLSERMRIYRTEPPGTWRAILSDLVCAQLSNIDPTGDHC